MYIFNDAKLTTQDIYEIVYRKRKVKVDDSSTSRVQQSFEFLLAYAKENLVYGVNTGFGPMAQYMVPREESRQLQFNLIRSHAAGSGEILSPNLTRTILLARLNTLAQGYSGINPKTIELLSEFLNHEIYPVIYAHGGVGASGDLVQLSHVALALIGEGKVWYEGKIRATEEVLKTLNIQPLAIDLREGLALINGTAAMNGIGFANYFAAKKLVDWVLVFSSMLYEILGVFNDFYSTNLNDAKQHWGQSQIARKLINRLAGSQRVKSRAGNYEFLENQQDAVLKSKMQEYYSIRCVPQILGPIFDTLRDCERTLINEINSVSDNPIIDFEAEEVFHGGNFHGDYVSFEMDKLKLAMIKLSVLVERQLNYLFNDKLNGILPPFINQGILGLNLGLQGTQFTATSTVAENRALGGSLYINSIPTNNDNQDVVSMGSNAAMMTQKVIHNTYEVLAVYTQAIVHAIDYLKIGDELVEPNKKVYRELKQFIPDWEKDIPYDEILRKIKNYLWTAQRTHQPDQPRAERKATFS
ncbi:MAG: aromatic amino acid ammonia-lyase [Saprospiraceae bacterium]